MLVSGRVCFFFFLGGALDTFDDLLKQSNSDPAVGLEDVGMLNSPFKNPTWDKPTPPGMYETL